MIFVLDNFDSFTYNIVQYLQQLGCEVVVRRNNAVTVDEVIAMNPEAIVLSPGPGRPEKAGIMLELIDRAKGLTGTERGESAARQSTGNGDLPWASGDWSGVWRQGSRREEDHARQDFGDHA